MVDNQVLSTQGQPDVFNLHRLYLETVQVVAKVLRRRLVQGYLPDRRRAHHVHHAAEVVPHRRLGVLRVVADVGAVLVQLQGVGVQVDI